MSAKPVTTSTSQHKRACLAMPMPTVYSAREMGLPIASPVKSGTITIRRRRLVIYVTKRVRPARVRIIMNANRAPS